MHVLRRVEELHEISISLNSVKTTADTRIVWSAALVALVIKLIIAATTIGTNDILQWQIFSEYIIDVDSIDIYDAFGVYNHPPLIALWLGAIGSATVDNLQDFALLMRLPAILADFGSVFLVLGLCRRYYSARTTLFATVIFALSPVLVLVSGFHGNTDPVFMFLLLAAIYLIGVKRLYVLGGVLFGLSLSIKIVPVLMIPAFFFWLRRRGGLGRFFGSAAAVVALGYAYHLVHASEGIFRNVLAYGGPGGIWGLGRILTGYETIGRGVLVVVVSGFVWIVSMAPRKAESTDDPVAPLLAAFAVTFLAFMVVTPGFGVQYLSWLVAPAVFVGLAFSVVYNVLAGWFLAAVYLFWSGGWPLDFADSSALGQWHGGIAAIELALWLFLALTTCIVVGQAIAAIIAEPAQR